MLKIHKIDYKDKWYKSSFEFPLITNFNTNKRMNESNMNPILNRIFKRTKAKIGVSMLRKIVITDYYKDSKSHSEKKDFSLRMGHNFYTNEYTYNKKK